jgi:hypothetical protein
MGQESGVCRNCCGAKMGVEGTYMRRVLHRGETHVREKRGRPLVLFAARSGWIGVSADAQAESLRVDGIWYC